MEMQRTTALGAPLLQGPPLSSGWWNPGASSTGPRRRSTREGCCALGGGCWECSVGVMHPLVACSWGEA